MTRYKQLTIIFIFLFIISGVISTQGTSKHKTPTLEELIINRVLSLYKNKNGLSSGFADGSTSNANWEDTVDAIETLALLDGLSQLSRVQKTQIIRFIDRNKVDEFDQTINNSRKIDWWGETKKSVEGLRVLQLLNHQNETVTNSVKNRICNNFVQEGIQWELEGPGWDKIYWGIYKPLEWNLFDILPNIGLTRLTNSALELARGNLLEISDEELFNQTQTITWSEGVNIYDEFDTSISHDSNLSDLNIPRLQNQFFGQKITFGNKYSPVVELTVNWDVWNDDNQLSIDNFENKTFGKLSGMIQNETINTPQLITLPDGSNRIIIITRTEERWNDASLDYNLFLQVLSSSGETVAEKSVRINTFGNNHITIPIQFLKEDESYSLSSYVIQNIHQLDNSYINLTLKHNNSQELQSILNETTINIGNQIYRTDELSIIESTNFQTTFKYLNSSEWVTNEKLVSIPLSISINTPNYGYVKLNYNPSSEEGSLIAILEHPSQTYRMLFFDNQQEDWNTLLTNYTSVRSVIMEGVNSLGISKSGSYNILLRNLNESLTYEEQLLDAFSQINFISYKTQHHFLNAPSLIQYQNLFNQTSGDLLKTLQQQEFLNMITYGPSVTNFLNDRVVSELMFLHYNSTLQTYENNLDISPRIWKVLDSLGKSDIYLSKSDYNNTLFKFMTDNYYETMDRKKGIVKEIKLATEENFQSEIQNLRSFGEIITYRSQWMYSRDNLRTPPQQVLGYVGTAIGTIDQEIDQNAIIAMARNKAQTEIYDPETMKVIDEIIALNNPPIDSAIHIKSSKYLSSEFMFWQKENNPIPINPVDLITNTFITIGIISSAVFMLVIDPKSSKNFLFINIALISIISMQGIVAPVIMNYQNISLSKYLSTFQTFLDKIEEGIYDVSQQLGHFFAKPFEISQQIGQGITSSINRNSKTNYNTTLKFQYNQYLIELDKTEKIFNQLDISPSHITRSLHSQIYPLSYNEFLMQIAEIEIQGLIADKMQEADNAAKLDKDRTLQRQLGFGEVLTVLRKSVSLSDEVIMGVGRAMYSASDDIWARAANLGDMIKANDFVHHLNTIQDTIETYAKSMNKNVYDELMGSVQKLIDDPSKIFEVKLIDQIQDGASDALEFLDRSLVYELEALSKTGIKDLAPSLATKLHKSIITRLFDVKWENVLTHIDETTNEIFSMAINWEKKSVHFITNNIDEVKNAWKSLNLSDLSFKSGLRSFKKASGFMLDPLKNDFYSLAPNMIEPLYKFLESLQIEDWYRLRVTLSGHSGTDIVKITILEPGRFPQWGDIFRFRDLYSNLIKRSLASIKHKISDMTKQISDTSKQIFSNTFESVEVFKNNNLDLLRGISNRVSDWVPRVDEFLDNIKNAAKFLPGKQAVKKLVISEFYKDLIQNISDPETLFRMTNEMYDLGNKTIRIKINSGKELMKEIIKVAKNYDGFKDLSTREIREIIESLKHEELIFKPDAIRNIIKEDIPLMKDLLSKGKVVNLFSEAPQLEQLVTKLLLNQGGKDLLSKLDDLNISPHLADAVKEIGTKGSFIRSTSSNLATGKLDMVIKAGKRAYAAIEAWGASKSLGSSVKIGDIGRNLDILPSKGQIDIARLYMLNITLDMDSMLIMPLKSGFTNAYERVSKIGQLGAKHTDETIDIGVTYFGKNTIGDVFEVTQKPSLITELLRTTYRVGNDKGYLKFIDDIYQEFGGNAKRIMDAITESKYNSIIGEIDFGKKADMVLKEIYNDYFSLVSFSPFQSNYQMNFNWNALDNFSDQIRSDVMYVEALEEQVGNVSGIRLDSKGYFAGDVGDASMTFLVNNGGISDTLPFNFPYSVDSLNNITSDDYTFSRLIAGGLIYDLDSSNPYESIERSYVNTNGVLIRSDGAVKTSYTTNSWNYTGTGQNFVKLSQPAIEQLTGKNGINLVDYPYFNWTWQNDPYEATETEVYNTGVDMEWTNKGWNQGQISFYVTDGTNSQWIAVVSTPDLTPTASNLIIGPTHATNGIEYLEPIVWIKQEGVEYPYTESFEHAFVPEEVNLLSLARQAGLTGDSITVKEVVMGVGPRVEDIYLHPGQDLTITDMKFLNKNNSEIDAWGQAALKIFYDIRDVAMGDDWVDYLETNKDSLDQDALELAIGVNDSDNDLNAQTWVQQAKEADLHDEFRYFYTTGLVIMRNTSEAGSPVRGIFGKNKLWGITSETLNANLYTQAGLTAKQEVILYLDPFYENGWETDLWINSIHELYSIFREVDLLPVIMNANQLKQYMTNEQSNGTVVLLGAIPDLIWDYRNPLILESDQTTSDWRQMLKNNSALEYFMENGGTVISTGQYGGGWKVAFYDDETGQTTIGDYNSTNNPELYDFNVDIGEILHDRSFYLDGYVPTVASRMVGTGDYATDIGNYYSLGLRDITGNKIVPIGESGNYDDMIWLVKEEGQQTLDVTDGTGLFVNFHTGTDNLSAGAINDFNFNSWLIDLIEIMTGIDIEQTESYDSSDFTASAVSTDRLYPNSDSTNGRANNPFYWYDTFLTGTEGWNNISTATLDDEKVGNFSSPYINKNLSNVSVNEYPYLQASVYTDFTPSIIDGYDFDEFPTSPAWSGTRDEANSTHIFENDSGNSQQFYYHWFDPLSTSNTNQTGTLDFTDLTVDQDTLFSFALNPVQLEAYEYASTVNIASGNQWDKFDHASEWWLEVEIDDGSGATKKIRYFFTIATPFWYKGSIVKPELGYPDNEYYEYDSGWTTEPRTNDNYEGIRWVRIPVSSDFDVNRRTDRTDEGSNPNTFTGTSTGQWTPVMRNIVNDYNVLFGQMTEELTITKINHVGHFLTGDAYVLIDDMMFSTVDTGKQVAMKTTVTDGEDTYNFIDAVSTNEWVDTLALEDESLELYYQLNSNTGTTVYDSSKNDRNSSSGTFPSWTSNSYASFALSSLNFDGSNDLILTDLDTLKGSNAVTVSMWHKLDSSFTDMGAPWSLLTSTAPNNADGFWWHINDTSDRIYVRVENGSNEYTVDFAHTITKNQWYLATWVIGTDSVSYYEDGDFVYSWGTTFDWSSLDTNTLQLRLGQGYNSGYYYKGMVDNVTVYSKALSNSEIMHMFETSGRRQLGETWTTQNDFQNSLVAYYPFEDDIHDYSSNGIDLTVMAGTPTFTDGGIQLSTSTSLESGTTDVLDTDTHTIAFKIKYTSNNDGSWRKIFGYTPTGSDRSPGIWKYPNTMQMHWRYDPGNTGYNSPNLVLNQWYDVVGVKDGPTFTFYFDGNYVGSATVANPKTAGSDTLWFGGAPVILKDFRIYNIALTNEDVNKLFQEQFDNNYYLTGSVVPTTSFNLKNETQEGWNTLTHDFSSLIAETSTPLFYSNDVSITSWNTNTYLDNVGVVGGMLPVLPTDSNNSANYVFNQTGLVLSSTGTVGNEGVRHQLDSSKLVQDYSSISFDIMVTTIDSSGDGEVDEPEIRISTSGANHYMAELASSSSGDPDYYHYGGITTPNRWYHFELSLMNFKNLNGERPDNQTVFNEILFLSRGTFYLDNVVLKGNSGTLISEDFEQYVYHSNYSNGILSETYFNSTWNDYNSSLSIIAEHTNINNSFIKVDIQEATELLTIVQGDSSKTLTLRLYGYREDGTKVTTGTYYLDLITTSNVLQGWNNNVEIITSLSSLSSDIRYLSCPEIIGATGSFSILALSTVNTDSPLNNPTSDSSNVVMNDTPHNPYGFLDNFSLGNVNNWILTQSDNASLTFEQPRTLKIDGGDSGQGEAVPAYVIDTEAFEITYRTKVTGGDSGNDDYTGWILNEGTSATNSYRHWLDIDDSTMPKADVVVEGTTSKDLVRNVDLVDDIAINEWMTYKIRKEGTKLQMWINNQLIMSVTDSSYTAPYKFGFSVNYTCVAEFDDLLIKPIESFDLTRDSPDVIYGEPTDKKPVALWDLSNKVLDPNDDPETSGEVYWLYDTSSSGNQQNSKIVNATYDDEENCFYFDGSSDYIEITDNSLLKPEEITVSTWLRISPDANTSIRHIFLCKWNGYSFELEANTMKPYFRITDGGDSPKGPSLVPGEWYHLVGTYEPGVGNSLFVNGTKIGTNYDASPINHSTYPLHIGKYRGGIYFNGHIASVSIYDTVLTPEEILYQYAPGMVLLPASSSAVLTNPYSTSSEWILNTSFAIPEGSTIGDYLILDIGEEDLIVSTSTMTNRLSLDVTQGEAAGGTFTDNFSTSWSADKNGVTSGDASPWTYGHITGSGDGNWNVGAGSSYNNQLEIHSTSDPNGGNYGEAHGVYQNVNWTDDFDVKVTIGRHDTSNTWKYWGKMTLLDEDDEIITTSYIYDSWAFSTAYKTYARAYDDSNVYNATYAYGTGYIYNYNATISFRMKRTDGEIKLWVDTDGNQSWDVGDLVVTRPSSSHTTRTVKKVILEGNAGGTYWRTGWYSFDDFSMQAGGSSENSVSIEEPILYSDQSDLILSLPLTEKEGLVVYDSSLYNNDGTLVNGTVLTRSTGAYFDGSDDYISTSLDLTDYNEYSISVWFKRDGKTSREEIIGQDAVGDRVFMLEYDPNRPVNTQFYTSNANNTIYGDDMDPGEWVHVVITEDGTTHKLYQNGVLKGTGNGNIPSISSQDLLIGRRMYSGAYDYFNGNIRNVQIWDRVLNEDEVKSLSNTFNLTSGGTGSLVPVSIQPLNDLSDRIQITIDNEDLYLENAGTDTFLNTVTISDPTGEGLIFSPIIVQSVNTQLTNEDGTISTIVPYTSLGYEIQDISHTSGKHMIINIDVRVDLENPSNGTLNIQPNSTGTGYSWSVSNIGADHNPAETIVNSQWTTLQVNTHETGTSTDKIRIYVSGNTGESVLTIGRVHIVEVSDLNNLASSSGDDLDAFLPYGYEYLVKSQGHSIYMDENTLVLEDNGHDTSNSDFSYVDIPVGNTPITDRTHISFDWYLGVEDPSSTIIEAGIYLPTSSEYIYHEDHWYFEPIENWPSKYSSSIRLHEDYPSGGEGTYKSDSWALSQMGSKSYDTWYRYIGYYLMDSIDFWIARGIRKTLIPGYSPLTITLGDGNSVGDLGITTDILEPYVNDWDNDGTCDYYNTLMHLDITLNDHVEGTWLDDIRIFIDGNGSNKKFRLEISNFRVYEELPSVLSMTDRRIGDKQTSNNYLTDWVASPFYPHFDTEERLPKSNIVINGDFEHYDDQITNPDPDGWTNGQFPAQSYIYKERDAWSTNGDYLFPSGKHALCLERDPDFNILYISTYDGATMTQSIDAGDVEAEEVLVSLWVYNPQASSLLVNVNGSSPQAVTPDSGKWVYWQGMFSLDATSSFVTVLLQQFGPSYIFVDDVRVEVTGWAGNTTYEDVSTLRGIDPLNISPYTFYDGWYEISNVVSDYIHSADVTAPQVKALWGYTQYFYTEINVDGPYSQDDTWQISLTEAQTTTNTYALWINGELQIVDKGAFTTSDLTLQRGSNSILLMQNVDCYTDYVTTYFKVQLSRPSWTDYSIFSKRPHINPTRSPLIYNDSQYQTKWIERDGSNSDLVLDLPLGEQTGSIALDHSYNGHDGAINGATWTTDGLTFDGSNDYVNIGDISEIRSNKGTVSAWINKSDNSDGFKVVFAGGHTSQNDRYYMCGVWYNDIAIYTHNDGYNKQLARATSAPDVDDGKWHHLTWQSNGSSTSVFVDGIEYPLVYSTGSDTGLWFDDFGNNQYAVGILPRPSLYGPWNGNIRDLQIQDRVLTTDEIQKQLLGLQQTLDIIDVPAMLASSMSTNLASMNLPATIGNSHRLHYYIYAEMNMASTGIADTFTPTGNMDTGYSTHQVKHWQSPYLSPMYTNITDGHSAGIEYLNNNSGTTTVYWTYEKNSTPEKQYPTYEYYEYKTSRLYNEAYGRKTIWHPFGSILMTTDVLSETVFDGIGWSKLEQFLEAGGKQIWSGGYIPYSYTSSGIGETPVAVTDGTSQFDYAGALGHQEVFDISSMNNGTTYGSRSNFSSGMFLSDQKDDMYDGIDTDYDGTPDEYLAIDENTPSITGVMGNLDDFNYEPIGGRSPVWTQLSHVGYSSHMVLTKHEYDIRQHLYGGLLEQNVSTKIENADGQSVESSSNEKSHRNPADLDRTYSGVLGDGSGAIPNSMYDEHYIDPQLAGLWFMPILGDTNGAYEYKPSSYTNSPVGYYGVRSGNPIYNERWTWSHHERVNVGTGLIQAGTNGKGIVGIAPMFDWSDTINGLNTEASDSAYYKGMYADRGKGSISNSPTTESMARKFTANVTGGSVIAMLLDCISINVVRDNSTTGTNFFNFNPRNELGKEPEQYNDSFNNGVVNSLVDRNGPIVVSTYTNRNLSGGTSDWDDYLAGQSNYSLFGASFPKAVANNQYDKWENQVYPVRITENTGYNLDDYDLQRIVPSWDGVNTRINIDNAFPGETAQTVKVLTLNGLQPDTINDPLLYANVLTSNHSDMSMYYGQYDVDSSDMPMNGINFGSDLSGTIPGFEHEQSEPFETPDATAVGWNIYNSKSSEFFDNYGNTDSIYGSDDKELVLRNSSINPMSSGIDGEYRNFGPLTYLDASEKDTLYNFSYSGWDGSEIGDGVWSGTNGWYINSQDFDADGMFIGSNGNNRLEGQFSSSDEQVNLIGVYSLYNPSDVSTIIDNTPKLIRITLINAAGEIVYTKNEILQSYSKFDTDTPPDGVFNSAIAGQPTFLNIPEGIYAKKISLEIWSVYEPSINQCYPGIGELEVYTGTNPDSKLINYTDTEFIPRAMETDAWKWITWQNPIYSIDDGNSQLIDDDPDYYRGRPSQQGNFRVNIGVKSNSKNPAMRYNAYYTSAIDVTSNQSSYEYGNQPNPDPWDIFWDAIWDNLLFFVLVIIVNILVLQWITAGSSWAWVGYAVIAFDLAPIGIMAAEIIFYGEMGGFTKIPLYHMIGFYQIYNIIMDWDSTIVRFCMKDVEYPFKVIFDY